MNMPDRPPNCLKCIHFAVTWEPKFPHSCKLFGVKSKNLPSVSVMLATGKNCPAFKKSSKIKD